MQRELYNKAYQKFTPDFLDDSSRLKAYLDANAESLIKFYKQQKTQFELFNQNKSCLELGSGLGGLGHYLAGEFKSVLSVDISDLAISMAKTIEHPENLDFHCMDVTTGQLNQKFDFIIDSHLFHCLVGAKQRQAYLSFVKNHLKEDGVFLLESMVFHEKLQVPVDYSFSENFVLNQTVGETEVPVRTICPSRHLEEEILTSGLKLNTFFYHHELSFQVFELYQNYPSEFLPKTVRLSAKLS